MTTESSRNPYEPPQASNAQAPEPVQRPPLAVLFGIVVLGILAGVATFFSSCLGTFTIGATVLRRLNVQGYELIPIGLGISAVAAVVVGFLFPRALYRGASQSPADSRRGSDSDHDAI